MYSSTSTDCSECRQKLSDDYQTTHGSVNRGISALIRFAIQCSRSTAIQLNLLSYSLDTPLVDSFCCFCSSSSPRTLVGYLKVINLNQSNTTRVVNYCVHKNRTAFNWDSVHKSSAPGYAMGYTLFLGATFKGFCWCCLVLLFVDLRLCFHLLLHFIHVH